ncbi:MAG: exodeoxyribonuclease I [Pseudomonadota bacterium]
MSDSFYWYDLETSGTDPKWDRIVQFAGCRTNLDLEPIDEPFVTYVRLPDDVLPNPDAALVTGITPQQTLDQGVYEWEAVDAIHRRLSVPGTCALGYNSLRFDDEFMRYALYRNFRDPYTREWQNGNSRWDLIDLVRATGALRREGINWPTDDDGLPVYKLEALTAANGIEHGDAHDAMADVRATLAMARLIKTHQPKLFEFHFKLRHKRQVRKQLEPLGEKIAVHVSGMYPRERFGCAPVLSLCQHPTNTNAIIVVDLLGDIEPLLELDAEALAERLMGDDPAARPGLKEVRLNRCPFVAPLSVLGADNLDHLNIDLNRVREQAQRLQRADLGRKISRVYARRQSRFAAKGSAPDPEAALYDGFLKDDDRSRCESFRSQVAEGDYDPLDFDDPRLFTLAERLRARRFPESLAEDELQGWRTFVANKLYQADAPWLTLPKLEARIAELRDTEGQATEVLDALTTHAGALAARYPRSLLDGGV